MFELINIVSSAIVFAGSTWACISHRVCDGVILKKGLIVVAFGAFANMINPSGHAKLIVLCGIAVIVAAAFLRWYIARIHHKHAVFFNG